MKSNSTNIYYICAIIMDLMQQRIENQIALENLTHKGKTVTLSHEHKRNHTQLMQGFKTMQRAHEHLNEHYPDVIGIKGFDAIRRDANFFLRMMMRCYNIETTHLEEIEQFLHELETGDWFTEQEIKRYTLR